MILLCFEDKLRLFTSFQILLVKLPSIHIIIPLASDTLFVPAILRNPLVSKNQLAFCNPQSINRKLSLCLMIPKDVLAERAKKLVHRLAVGCTQTYGFSSMSPAVYDTAWVALVQKQVDGRLHWLFPECLQFLLENQREDGIFGNGVSNVDDILNTSAALFALLRHSKSPLATASFLTEVQLRITRSKEALNIRLTLWDVEASDHVGFEILVPAMLQYLENEGVVFEFPQRQELLALNRKKLTKFSPQMIYDQQATTLVHSLEAFVGQIDFDLIMHQKSFGSMMASPASTAAYLINTSIWDDEAEDYLRNVICYGKGQGKGGVPSAFPTTIFEVSWVS